RGAAVCRTLIPWNAAADPQGELFHLDRVRSASRTRPPALRPSRAARRLWKPSHATPRRGRPWRPAAFTNRSTERRRRSRDRSDSPIHTLARRTTLSPLNRRALPYYSHTRQLPAQAHHDEPLADRWQRRAHGDLHGRRGQRVPREDSGEYDDQAKACEHAFQPLFASFVRESCGRLGTVATASRASAPGRERTGRRSGIKP